MNIINKFQSNLTMRQWDVIYLNLSFWPEIGTTGTFLGRPTKIIIIIKGPRVIACFMGVQSLALKIPLQMKYTPVPLSNAGSTSISEYDSTNITQDLWLEEGQPESFPACFTNNNSPLKLWWDSDSHIHPSLWWLGFVLNRVWPWTGPCTSGLYPRPAWPERLLCPCPRSLSWCSSQSDLQV